MHRERPGWAADLGFAFCVAIGLTVVAELAVRLAGVEPGEIPFPGSDTTPPSIRVDPLFGARPKPGWSGDWSSAGFPVSIDDRGFRSTGRRPAGRDEARIAFLGDSCTFGWGLGSEDTFVAGVEKMAEGFGHPVEVINAAYPGDSAVSGSHVLTERVLPLNPDVVVLGFSGNNAFRFSRVADTERFRFFAFRKLLLHSRLFQIANAWAARKDSEKPHPRDKDALRRIPLADRRRVAKPAEFEGAMRSMIERSRDHGSSVVILLFPRASEVSDGYGGEDAVVAYKLPLPPPDSEGGQSSRRDEHLLQYSCLDHGEFDDPIAAVHARIEKWQRVFPRKNARRLRRKLAAGATAYAENRLSQAERRFRESVAIAPNSPLAFYDLGATLLERGENGEGLAMLARAEQLACNVFLRYQVIVRRLAAELDVPVVDLMLYFQAEDAVSLFIDPAHPSARARDIISGALWPVLRNGLGAGRAGAEGDEELQGRTGSPPDS